MFSRLAKNSLCARHTERCPLAEETQEQDEMEEKEAGKEEEMEEKEEGKEEEMEEKEEMFKETG